MRITVDTNVLVYAYDREAGKKHERAVSLMERVFSVDAVLTLRVLGGLFRVMTRKRAIPISEAAEVVHELREALPVVAADEDCLVDAMAAVRQHDWSFWDAMIWATARRAGCGVLLSEDGQHGRTLGGVTIINPFTPTPHPLHSDLMRDA